MTEIRKASAVTGLSVAGIRSGMLAAETDDTVVGAGYALAQSLAVRIKGDRHKWNLDYAHGMEGRIRSMMDEHHEQRGEG